MLDEEANGGKFQPGAGDGHLNTEELKHANDDDDGADQAQDGAKLAENLVGGHGQAPDGKKPGLFTGRSRDSQ